MILIPQRLFSDARVKVILRDGNNCILTKELQEPLLKRQGYISNHVISVLLAGEQHIETYEGRQLVVKPNEIIFIPRGLYYISDLIPSGGHFKSVLFYFDDRTIHEFLSTSKVTAFSKEAAPDHLHLGAIAVVRQFVESLLHIYAHNQISSKSILQLKTLELLHLLNGLVSAQKLADFLFRLTLPKKRSIKSFMENNYDKPLKVEDYAYLTGRSLSSFRRDFKTFYGSTPQKWLKDRRLDKAVDLFQQRERSVGDVAYEVGYENTSYFIREFKKRVGQSPKQYLLKLHRKQ
ncbi:MAG: AraC family transcriptional regulator [Bacteroidota bacterium]